MEQVFSIKQALSFGWDKAKQHLWLFVKIMLVVMAIVLAGGIITALFREGSLLASLVNFALQVFTWFVTIAMILIMLRLARGETITFTQAIDIFKGLVKDPSLIVTFLLVLGVAQLLIGIGFLALIIPGVYLMLRYSQVRYLVVDKKVSFGWSTHKGLWKTRWQEIKRVIREGLRMSSDMTQGVKWQLLWFALACAGVALVGFIPGILTLGIGLVFVGIMLQFASVHVYMKLLERVEKKPAPAPVSELASASESAPIV